MATATFDVPEGLPYVDITREFNAPRSLIHRAYTDPELIPQWLGPAATRWTSRSGRSVTGAPGVTSDRSQRREVGFPRRVPRRRPRTR